MKAKKTLTLSLIFLMVFTWSTSTATANPNAGEHCPEDQMPEHVGETVKSHAGDSYIHFWKGIHKPPGCRGLLPR